MPLYSTVCPLPINRKIFRHRGSVSPIPQSGLALWLKADAGISASELVYMFRVTITGAGTVTSNGVYSRSGGGNTSFNADNGYIAYGYVASIDSNAWYIQDFEFGGQTYYATDNTLTTWAVIDGDTQLPTGTTENASLSSITWADQSSNGNNFTPSIGTAIKYNNIIGSNPAVLFDGPRLAGSNIDTAKTIYAVIKTLETSASQYAVILEATGGSLYSAINETEWGSYFNAGIGAGQTLPTSTAAIIATISDDGATYEYRKNGQQVLTNTDGSGFYTRSVAFLGNDGSAGQAANVYVSEIIVYDRVPTSTEIQQIETYLNTKYAIY